MWASVADHFIISYLSKEHAKLSMVAIQKETTKIICITEFRIYNDELTELMLI